eukprot:GHUV01016463.1.p3 GENE.GHUV01016463.1~~GHUV01016463.1.p3  ORF type:complete len:159 (-),score=26.67 GHUV01016463.1:1838-2314(-)
MGHASNTLPASTHLLMIGIRLVESSNKHLLLAGDSCLLKSCRHSHEAAVSRNSHVMQRSCSIAPQAQAMLRETAKWQQYFLCSDTAYIPLLQHSFCYLLSGIAYPQASRATARCTLLIGPLLPLLAAAGPNGFGITGAIGTHTCLALLLLLLLLPVLE